MKILFVVAHIGKGGGQAIQIARIITEMKNQGHACTLLTLKANGNLVKEPCKTIYTGNLEFPKGVFNLYKKIKEIGHDYDLIQCFDINYSLPATFLYGKKPYFLRMGMNPYKEFRERKLYLYYGIIKLILPTILKKAKKIIVNSKTLEREFPRYKPKIIQNGFDFDSIKTNKSKINLRKELNLPLNKNILVYTGKIIPRKNLEVVFKALKKLKNVHLVLVGQRNEEHYGDRYYRTLIKKYSNLNDRYTFTGEIRPEQVIDYLHASDIFVFPSKLEGSPNSVLEAMLCKLPVICSNIPEHRFIMENHVGLLFKTKKDLVDDLKMLLNNPNLRKSIGIQSYDYVKKNHDIKKAVELYLKEYSKVVK